MRWRHADGRCGMTGAPRRPNSDETTPQRRGGRRTDVPLETFEQDVPADRDTARQVQENPDGSARALDPTESREAAIDEAGPLAPANARHRIWCRALIF